MDLLKQMGRVDPYFVNYRLCFDKFDVGFLSAYKRYCLKETESTAKFENSRLCTDLALQWCRHNDIKTLGAVLQNPREGQVFCSTEVLAGNKNTETEKRIQNQILLPYEYDKEVYLDFGIEHFTASTGIYEQTHKTRIAIIGCIRMVEPQRITIYPLVMGIPSFDASIYKNNNDAMYSLHRIEFSWLGNSNYEMFPENIDEFSDLKTVTVSQPNEWMNHMRSLSEADLKQKLCQVLGDTSRNDWGGEQADHFSTRLHINGKRISAAFLLKGPAHFQEMTPRHCGQNGDQIYRLAQTSCDLLIVQHCHNIGDAVRATLRAFAVTPHNPRFYCLMDGKDTYKILKAYNQI